MAQRARRALAALALLGLGGPAAPAGAEVVTDQGAPLAAQLADLATGDQLLVAGRTETVDFAGQPVRLDGFSGMFGFASAAAYVLVVDGDATIGGRTAGRGRMLMIAPYDGTVARERFDAARLHRALAESAPASPLIAPLERLAAGQRRGVFLGRLAPTSFNIGTMNSASAEQDRRARVGGKAVRSVRFGGTDADGVEARIVAGFAAALAAGDAEGAAQFLDPLPYGYNNLEQGGGEARRLMAHALLGGADWRALAAGTPRKVGPTSWLLTGAGTPARITLRRTSDFAFVQAVEMGE